MVTLQEFMGKVLAAPSAINQLRNKVSNLTEGLREFAQKSQPRVNTTAIGQAIQDDFNTFWRSNAGNALVKAQRFVENAPRFTFADQQRSLPARFLYGIPQAVLNVPSDILTSGARLGRDFREGRLTDPRALISDLAGAALPVATIASLGTGPTLARSGVQALGRGLLDQSFKNFIKQSAKVGAGYGGTFSMLESLKQNRYAPNLQEQLTEGFQSFLTGAGLGAGLGVAVPLGLKGAGAAGSQLLQRPGLQAGFAKIPGKQTLDRLDDLMNYSTHLRSMGFQPDQIERISVHRYRDIIKRGVTPQQFNEENQMGTQMIDEVIRKQTDPKKKVNILDYFRTPDRVLNKMGLGDQAQALRVQWEKYLQELPGEINKIKAWQQRVPNQESSIKIFRYLDGRKIQLDPTEQQVTNEIKDYLAGWANKLNLPKEKRITDYITHIWEKGEDQSDFPEDIAKIISERVPGSVYDPFTERRLGKLGYVEDTFRALDAYAKRATRKYNVDPVLKVIADKAEDLELSQYKYIKSYIDRVNLRPTDIDNLVDNLIKTSPVGYRFGARPTTTLTQGARQMVFRGLLGGNIKSALLNLTQGVNTYSTLGERYTLLGYTKVVQNLPKFLRGKETELERLGVLRDPFIQDRQLGVYKSLLGKLDEGLFYLFNNVEKINRGAAYFGAKAKGLTEGMNEREAIEYAKSIVRKTQFTFGAIDTPLALSSDILKTFGQFQTYTLKQIEFLVERIAAKDVAGLIRYVAGSLLMVGTIGRLWGMEIEDLIPTVRIGIPPTMQLPAGAAKAVFESRDQFGNELSLPERVLNPDVLKGLINYVPGGAQLRKIIQGIQAGEEGGIYTPSEKLKFPSEGGARDIIFGPGTSEAAKEYYSEDLKPLSDLETRQYQYLTSAGVPRNLAYQKIREQQKADEQFKKSIEGKKDFNWFGLFSRAREVSVTTATPTLTGDPLIDAMTQEKQLDEGQAKIREVFNLGLPKEQTERILQTNNLGTFEEASVVAIKSLGIESGARPEYIKKALLGLDHESYLRTVYELAEKEILTTGVTAYWLDQGDITYDQKKAIDRIISATKGKISTGGGRRLKLPTIPGGAITVRKVALPKRRPIKVPKIKLPENKLTPVKKLTPPKIQLLEYRKGGSYA